MASVGEYIAFGPALVVEDHEPTRQRLVRLLAELIGTTEGIDVATGVAEAKTMVAAREPGLALIDIGLPDGCGLELIDWLQHHHPDVAAVAISAWGHEEVVLAALRFGAIGYLLKERDDAELLASLQSVRRGGALIDPLIARRILALVPLTLDGTATTAGPPNGSPFKHDAMLSERESEILRFVARGFSNREIAELVDLSRFTIEGYIKSIYRKLAVNSRTSAVFEAKAMGLL